jgi:hypothetical protein
LELQSELASAYEKIGDVQGALNNQNLGDVKAGLENYEKARKLREAVFAADAEIWKQRKNWRTITILPPEHYGTTVKQRKPKKL